MTTNNPSKSSQPTEKVNGPNQSPEQQSQPQYVHLPPTNHYKVKGDIPNTPLVASIIAATLGGLVSIGFTITLLPLIRCLSIGKWDWEWVRPQLGMYMTAMGLFHLLEFWTTAGWNREKLSVDSFLINNGKEYHYAHAFGLAEYFISSFFWPNKFHSKWCSPLAISGITTLLLLSQALRSIAMIQASSSFSHLIKTIKLDDHVLVTWGVYGWTRHPSYAGFFYWAISTQLLLGNIISTLMFIVVLGRFFTRRIIAEEEYLVKFFGDDYVQYRKRVGTGLPLLVNL